MVKKIIPFPPMEDRIPARYSLRLSILKAVLSPEVKPCPEQLELALRLLTGEFKGERAFVILDAVLRSMEARGAVKKKRAAVNE